MRIEDALRVAADADLDLVEVAPDARPPVCKIMDYGKFKYEAAQKARESRKNQQQTVVKEQKLRPKIDDHDYATKRGHVIRFLEAGAKVKVTIMFRGREQSRPELGYRLLQRLGADVADYGFVETSAKQDGRNMTMVLAPHRGAKTRARAAEDASWPHRQARTHWRRRTVAELTHIGQRTHAQDQDPQRSVEAIPAHRNREDRASESQPSPPARAQADQADATPGWTYRRGGQRHQAGQETAERLTGDRNSAGTTTSPTR